MDGKRRWSICEFTFFVCQRLEMNGNERSADTILYVIFIETFVHEKPVLIVLVESVR